MLELKNISLTLSKNTRLQRPLFKELNLNIAKGEFVVLIGGNGSGKSTLFNVISGALQPDSGEVLINEKNVTRTSHCKRAKLVSKVMQDPKVGTMEQMTVEENLSFAYLRGESRGLRLYKSRERRSLFEQKLSLLNMGLEKRMGETVDNLSGGQRQALSLIMSILAESTILLLDEITAALDPKAADLVIRLAARVIDEEGLTAMMTTHNMHHALCYGGRILLLEQGQIIKEFSAEEKKQLTPQALAAEFGEI